MAGDIFTEQIASLPFRAIMAMCCRCARRVESFTASLPSADRKMIETAIRRAEGYAKGEAIDVDKAIDALGALQSLPQRVDPHSTQGTAAGVICFTAGAMTFAAAADQERTKAGKAQHIARFATFPGDVITLTSRAFEIDARTQSKRTPHDVIQDIRRDLERLADMKLGTFGECGDAIDPSEHGPLGHLIASEYGVDRAGSQPASAPREVLAEVLRFTCSTCGASLKTSTRQAGKTSKCPKCGHQVQAPSQPSLNPENVPTAEPVSAKDKVSLLRAGDDVLMYVIKQKATPTDDDCQGIFMPSQLGRISGLKVRFIRYGLPDIYHTYDKLRHMRGWPERTADNIMEIITCVVETHATDMLKRLGAFDDGQIKARERVKCTIIAHANSDVTGEAGLMMLLGVHAGTLEG